MNPVDYDKRVINRNFEKGIISKEEYENFLKALPDLEDQSEVIDVSLYDDDSESEAEAEAETGGETNPGENVGQDVPPTNIDGVIAVETPREISGISNE